MKYVDVEVRIFVLIPIPERPDIAPRLLRQISALVRRVTLRTQRKTPALEGV